MESSLSSLREHIGLRSSPISNKDVADRLTSLPLPYSLHRPFEDLIRQHAAATAVADFTQRSQSLPHLSSALASGYHNLLQQHQQQQHMDATAYQRTLVPGLLAPHLSAYQQQLLMSDLYSRHQVEQHQHQQQRWLTAVNEHRQPEGSRCGSDLVRTGRDLEEDGGSRSPDSPSATVTDASGSGMSRLRTAAATPRDDCFSDSSDGEHADDEDIEFNLGHRSSPTTEKCKLADIYI